MKTTNLYNVLGHANQFAFDSWEKSIFQSYNSVCAIIDRKNETLTLGKDWDYSKTTRKHLYAFFSDMWLHSLKCIDDVRNALKIGKIWNFNVEMDYNL
jgi:hypothetical protein